MVKGIPVVLTVKHTTQRDGTWKYQSFRNWRSQFNFQHTKHCFCTYGLKLHNQPFHRKMNVLSSGLSLQDSMCKKWSDGDSPLTAKDAQRLQSLERHFFTIAAKRWCSHLTCNEATSSNLDSGACTLQIDPSEDVPLEAQHGPESVREPEKAYPTDARERQKKREKLAKERGEEKSVKKRKRNRSRNVRNTLKITTTTAVMTYHPSQMSVRSISSCARTQRMMILPIRWTHPTSPTCSGAVRWKGRSVLHHQCALLHPLKKHSCC